MPVVLSKQQVNKLIDVTINPKHKAIIALLYSSGIRRDELLKLKLSDIDTDRMTIRIHSGKGDKSRDVILATRTLELLRAYYLFIHPKPETYVFESTQVGKPYSATSVSKIITKSALRAGIQKPISAHTLRHTFATHMLEQGVNLKLIQRMLGPLKSTMVYLHLSAMDPSVKSPIDHES